MNYFAHGYRFVDSAYFLAGTAVPDWLSVADRKVRARSKGANQLLNDTDPRVAALAAGIAIPLAVALGSPDGENATMEGEVEN